MTIIVQSLRPDPTTATGDRVEWSEIVEHDHAPTAWRRAWLVVDGACASRSECRKVKLTDSTWYLCIL